MTDVTAIAGVFAGLKQSGSMALMPFVTAGDPDLETTASLLEELARRGADLVEVGFPYSDPIADGPVIQASYTRALDCGFNVPSLFERFEQLDTAALPPLIAMVSYSIVFRTGPRAFVDRAAAAGFAGMIVPDLPGDEAGELVSIVRAAGLDLVQLVAPTTPPGRVDRIVEASSGFLYCISVAGTTGVRDRLPDELDGQLAALRERTELPLAVGFGVSRPEHVSALRGQADGAIVGSALVRQLEPLADGSAETADVVTAIGDWVAELAEAAHAEQVS